MGVGGRGRASTHGAFLWVWRSEPDKKKFFGAGRGGPGRGAEGEGVGVGVDRSGGSGSPGQVSSPAGGFWGRREGAGGGGGGRQVGWVRGLGRRGSLVRGGRRGVGFGWWTSGSGGVGGRGRASTHGAFLWVGGQFRRF